MVLDRLDHRGLPDRLDHLDHLEDCNQDLWH